MPIDLSAQIEQAAADPQSATSDNQSATARPIADLIAADQYLAAKAAIGLKYRGIRMSKILPAGPVSDMNGSRVGGGFNTSGGLV